MKKFVEIIINYFLSFLSVLYCHILMIVLILPIGILVVPFKRETRTKISSPFWNLFCRLMVKYGFFAEVIKIDKRPQEIKKLYTPPGLHISNHVSAMDIPLIYSVVDIPPIMKKSVLWVPIFGLCAYSAGAITVDRANGKDRRRVLKAGQKSLLEGLRTLLYFPEGTRQKHSERPREFEAIKRPLLDFAYDNNVPVYSIGLYATKKVFDRKYWYIRYGQTVGILLQEALYPENFSNKDDFAQACWENVHKAYDELEGKLNFTLSTSSEVNSPIPNN